MDCLVAEPLVDLGPYLEGCSDHLAVGVGFDGAVYVAARRSSEPPRDGERHWKTQLDEPTEYVVLRADGSSVATVLVRAESLHVSHVQPCPEGLLLVGARCDWHPAPGGPEKNALKVDLQGEVISRFTLGDGINDVRVAHDGTTWVGYFDEGVFGNCGWGGPGPEPIGAAGLVAFDTHGNVALTYDASAADGEYISDAYALNVTDDGAAWVYPYTSFPLVRIFGGRYDVWPVGTGGARAFAVRGREALLVGEYGKPGIARRLELPTSGRARVASEVEITTEDGKSLDGAAVHGQNDRIVIVRDRVLHTLADW